MRPSRAPSGSAHGPAGPGAAIDAAALAVQRTVRTCRIVIASPRDVAGARSTCRSGRRTAGVPPSCVRRTRARNRRLQDGPRAARTGRRAYGSVAVGTVVRTRSRAWRARRPPGRNVDRTRGCAGPRSGDAPRSGSTRGGRDVAALPSLLILTGEPLGRTIATPWRARRTTRGVARDSAIARRGSGGGSAAARGVGCGPSVSDDRAWTATAPVEDEDHDGTRDDRPAAQCHPALGSRMHARRTAPGERPRRGQPR
jgi:hypothetical protein